MNDTEFVESVRKIVAQDRRYAPDAYLFVREALDFTVRLFKKPATQPGRHVSGQELLDGVRAYALQEFGPMALTVLNAWGVRTTMDFGEIVFNLVNAGILGKTSADRKEDFADRYDFHETFAAPFLPQSDPSLRMARPRPGASPAETKGARP